MHRTYVLPLAFVLSVSVLAGCGMTADEDLESYTMTAEDAAEISALLDAIEQEQQTGDDPVGIQVATGTESLVTIDVASLNEFDSLRAGIGEAGDDVFRVTNVFLNVREGPSVRARQIAELEKGDQLLLLSFHDASWAHIELPDSRTGYVSTSYIAQVTTEEQLPDVKKKYEGQYFVDYTFLNVRNAPSSQGQKLGELQSNQIVTPIAFHDEWARIPFEGQEGFVSTRYLTEFSPSVVVRQEGFSVPILHYRADEEGVSEVLAQHIAQLRESGKRIITLRSLYELLQEQEERDVRVPLDAVVLVISELSQNSLRDISDVFRASGVRASMAIRTSLVQPNAIELSLLQSLVQDGQDLQSAGHQEQDYRAVTDDAINRDLQQSRQILQDAGADPLAIVYPAGGVNERVITQAKKTGFLFGVTLSPPLDSGFGRADFLQLPTYVLSTTTSNETLKDLVGIE